MAAITRLGSAGYGVARANFTAKPPFNPPAASGLSPSEGFIANMGQMMNRKGG